MHDLVHDPLYEIWIASEYQTLTILIYAELDVTSLERIDLVLEEEQSGVDL
jgi:hypothetical protein